MAETGSDYLVSDTKRRLDVAGSILLAGALLPLTAATAVVSSADARRMSPIFRQQRVGQGGKLFETLKFHSLRPDRVRGELITHGSVDPRATWIGSLMRQWGLDELPQFVNVLRGDMSLVGPRPHLELDLEKNEAADPVLFHDWYQGYGGIWKPGLTGRSQVYRRTQPQMTDSVRIASMRMDLEDMDSASFVHDLRAIAATPLAMFCANIGATLPYLEPPTVNQ